MASTCATCLAGSYSLAPGGASVCTRCPAGTFSNVAGATAASPCTTCAQGTYAASGATVCSSCPTLSNTSGPGASRLSDCACVQGQFGDPGAFQPCGQCAKNNYCNATTQTPCPAGYFSLAGSTLVSQCRCQDLAAFDATRTLCTCLPGYYMNPLLSSLGRLGDRECVACPPNAFCRLDARTECPSNSKAPANSSLLEHCRCDDGYYWDAGSSTCPICPANSYCRNNSLTPCPANTNSPARSSRQGDCRCNAGYKCRRVRDARVIITFQLTQSEFNARSAAIASRIAAVVGVPASAVVLKASVPSARRRRNLLNLHENAELEEEIILEISAHIAAHTGSDLTAILTA